MKPLIKYPQPKPFTLWQYAALWDTAAVYMNLSTSIMSKRPMIPPSSSNGFRMMLATSNAMLEDMRMNQSTEKPKV